MKANGGRAVTKATVEIERDALERLENARNDGETLSEVIKRCVRPRQSAKEILQAMRRAPISPKTLRSIEQSADRRRQISYKAKD